MHASFSVSAICLGPRAFPLESGKALGTRLRTNRDECVYGRRVARSLYELPGSWSLYGHANARNTLSDPVE